MNTALAAITIDMLKKLRPFKQIVALGGSAAFASTLLISSATPSFAKEFIEGKYTNSVLYSRTEVKEDLAKSSGLKLLNAFLSAIPGGIGSAAALVPNSFQIMIDSAVNQNKCLKVAVSKKPVLLLAASPYNGRPFKGGPPCRD